MKKLVCGCVCLGVFLCLGTLASAMVEGVHEERTNWRLTYPVVTTEDPRAQENIRKDLARYIDALRADFDQGKYYSCGGNYKVHYEDDDILSISLYMTRYPFRANGNHTRSIDIVYDKRTGERIPLSNYVKVTAEDLDYYKYGHTYSQGGESVPANAIWENSIKAVPENYFLPGGGIVCVVFAPYDRAPGVYGATYIELDPEYIEYLNRKNQWM